MIFCPSFAIQCVYITVTVDTVPQQHVMSACILLFLTYTNCSTVTVSVAIYYYTFVISVHNLLKLLFRHSATSSRNQFRFNSELAAYSI